MTLSRFTIWCAIAVAALAASSATALPIHDDDFGWLPDHRPLPLFELEGDCGFPCAEFNALGGVRPFWAALLPVPKFVAPRFQGIDGSSFGGWSKVVSFCEANADHEKCSKKIVPTVTVVASVPEPGTLYLLGAGLLGLLLMAGTRRGPRPRAQQF